MLLRMARATFASALAATLAAGPARAAGDAPNPFDDYAATHPEAPPVEAVTPPTRPGGRPAEASQDIPLKRGNWMVGGHLTFAYAGSNSDLLSGGEESNTNLFLRASPRVAYFVMDRLEIGASLGLLTKSIGREGQKSNSENDFLIEGTASYLVPVVSRFALAPAAGLGFYFGSSSRPLLINGNLSEEETSTRGIAFSLYPMLAYQLTPDWQLRSGLSITLLYGSEKVGSADKSLATSAAYIGLPFQLNYTFR